MTVAALPSGPRFPALQVLRMLRDTTGFFQACKARYGDPFRAVLPVGEVLVTGDPEALREIFSANPDTFEPLGQLPLAPAVGDNSILLMSGQRHRRERKLLMPPFHGERMRAYGKLIAELAEHATDALRPGDSFLAQDVTQSLSLEVIIRAVFGIEEPDRVGRYRDVLVSYVESYTPLLMVAKPLRRSFGGVGPWARFQRAVSELDALLTDELATRRGSEGHTDILSLLLAARDEDGQPMSDVELKDELRTLLLAGHETTAIGMAWALYHLHRNPETLEALQKELAPHGPSPEPEVLAKLPYLGAVCDEALRLHPVIPMIGRRTVAPFTLRGRELPVGSGVVAAIALVHADPTIYPEPERFRPERFLERRYSPFEYLPFGGGARRCIGAAFAQYEMRIGLGVLLAQHKFMLADDVPERPVRRNVAIGPGRGVPLVYQGRRDGARG